MDQKALDQALARFDGFTNNLPPTISESLVKEYHSIVVADDVIDWLVEPAAMAKYRTAPKSPIQAGRNVGDENRSAQEFDKEHAEKQRILAAKKANAAGYASARKVVELFILEGRLGETQEYRNELLRYIAKQELAGKNGQNVYKEVERLASERYHAHRRRLETV